ncbi:hypothetical protein GCM10017788_65390 [Amycolatopsis acidiphila]|nr:hypothetical protein GCM10017788_65390 [Amycolatopsis acidiphila]
MQTVTIAWLADVPKSARRQQPAAERADPLGSAEVRIWRTFTAGVDPAQRTASPPCLADVEPTIGQDPQVNTVFDPDLELAAARCGTVRDETLPSLPRARDLGSVFPRLIQRIGDPLVIRRDVTRR